MDLRTEKLNLIEWLAGINDKEVIDQFLVLQKSNQQNQTLSESEKSAIDAGLKSLDEDRVHSHESVMQSIQEKFPELFR
ncbi:MAG: hypothetical protein RIF46_00915 [Cyclobacteriaceae bacterium]